MKKDQFGDNNLIEMIQKLVNDPMRGVKVIDLECTLQNMYENRLQLRGTT